MQDPTIENNTKGFAYGKTASTRTIANKQRIQRFTVSKDLMSK